MIPKGRFYDDESGEVDLDSWADAERTARIDDALERRSDYGQRREDHPNRKVHRDRFD